MHKWASLHGLLLVLLLLLQIHEVTLSGCPQGAGLMALMLWID
jgi:hypothetical protein